METNQRGLHGPSLHFFHLHLYPFFFWFTAGPQRKLVDSAVWWFKVVSSREVDCIPTNCIQLYMSYSERMLSLEKINNQMSLHYSSQIIDTNIIYMFIILMIRDSLLSTCLSSQQHRLFQQLAPGLWTQIQTPAHGPRQHTATGTFTIQNRGCIEIVCTNRLQTKLPVFVALIHSLQSFLAFLYCISLWWYVVLWSSISKSV